MLSELSIKQAARGFWYTALHSLCRVPPDIFAMAPPSILIVNATTPTAQSLQRAAMRSKARPDLHALASDPLSLPSELRALYHSVHSGDVCRPSTVLRVARQTQVNTVITCLDGGFSNRAPMTRSARTSSAPPPRGSGSLSSSASLASVVKRRRADASAAALCARAVGTALRGRPIRVVLISTLGAGGSTLRVGCGVGTMVRLRWWRTIRDCDAAETEVLRVMDAASAQDRLMIVRPSVLTVGDRRGNVHVLKDEEFASTWRVSCDDVADWIVAQICGEGEYFGQCVNLTGKRRND